jgi:hypothetical protein
MSVPANEAKSALFGKAGIKLQMSNRSALTKQSSAIKL